MPLGIIARMGAAAADELLLEGRAALAAAKWETARVCFEQAISTPQ